MDTVRLGRLLRMLRLRRKRRQVDVAAHAGMSAAAVGRHENGRVLSLRALERHAAVFGLRLEIRLLGRAGEIGRLADEDHAALVEWIAAWLRAQGLLVELEASFSEWGERGRVDLLAFHPQTSTLLLVEAKTLIVDLQELMGGIGVKQRLAATLAERRGWAVNQVAVLLAIADGAANRAVVRTHPETFADWQPRPLSLRSLTRPGRSLCWIPSQRTGRDAWLATSQRVRRPPRGR
jgi:transcriptional regulator with XRE-family HTH domain